MPYSTLISAKELNLIIDDASVRLFDCRFNLMEPEWGYQQFQNGHIPNSQYADLNKQLAGPVLQNTGRHPLPDKTVFEQQLREWGVNTDNQIVVYDDAGGAIAARLWWMCLWAGLEHVALLNGGVQAWITTGFELTQGNVHYETTDFVANYDDSLWISTKEIENLVNEQNKQLIDARANARYRGEHEPIDPLAGHIPTAINLPFDENLDQDGYFLQPDQLAKLHHSDSAIAQTISMCGSGVTACHNMLARAHAGLDMGKLYVGSWSEWITDSSRPVETELKS